MSENNIANRGGNSKTSELMGELSNNLFVTPITIAQENDKKIVELMGELKKSILDLTKAKLAYARSKSKEIAKGAINKCKNNIYSAAKSAKINLKPNLNTNFKTNLQNNTNKYNATQNEVDEILEKYETTINALRDAYEKTSKENTLKTTELYAKKDELLAEFSVLKDKRKEYIELNEEKLNEQLAPLEAEKAKYEEEAISAIKNGDYEKSKELLNKCNELKLSIYREEEKYSHIKNPYTEKLKENMKEFQECKRQIKEMEDLAKELELEFNDNCEKALESKEQALAKVQNNKMFDKIKGFLSKSVLKNINKAQKFQKNTLTPMKDKVKKFASTVPEKAEAMKEKSKARFNEIMSKGKEVVENTKEKVVEKAKDARDFASDKVQDAKEGISQARDYLNGKTYQAVEAAYDFGVNTKAKGRESAINFLERKAKYMNEKAENMKEKNKELEEKYNKRNNEKALF